MPRGKGSADIELLLKIIDQSYDHIAWHGTNLRGSVRGLTLEEAAWRPSPGRHNIWENMVHAAYWKYTVRRRLLKEKRGSFALKGSNWFIRPETLTEEAWRTDVRLLEDTHRSLRQAIQELSPARLYEIPAGKKIANAAVIYGIASHDVYHAGQIQLLKRLFRTRSTA
jgi:hypothetical protein